jgi:hypothetical protein
MPEFEVKADSDTNRLYLRLAGFFREADVQPTIVKLEEELAKMRPDFDVVVDISQFMPGSAKAADALRRGGEMVKLRGRRRAVRIAGGIITGFMQFKRMMGGVFAEDESVRYASSVAEADRILDEWDR